MFYLLQNLKNYGPSVETKEPLPCVMWGSRPVSMKLTAFPPKKWHLSTKLQDVTSQVKITFVCCCVAFNELEDFSLFPYILFR
jgi:hypothetical protein